MFAKTRFNRVNKKTPLIPVLEKKQLEFAFVWEKSSVFGLEVYTEKEEYCGNASVPP